MARISFVVTLNAAKSGPSEHRHGAETTPVGDFFVSIDNAVITTVSQFEAACEAVMRAARGTKALTP